MYNLQSDKEQYFRLGRIIKTYSYQGELIIYLETDEPESYHDLEMVFINIEQSLVPWFISKISIQNDLATIKFEDLEELETAREFVGREVYLPIDKMKQREGHDYRFHEVIGFRVIDKNHGDIGIVADILERPEQKILRIMKGNIEILVPLTDEMIEKVDQKGKVLHLHT
ncbi:MAG: ribosome maturation factor RimM, partial [Bacteroidota bacterium]